MLFTNQLNISKRSSTPQVISKLTQTVFANVSRILNENDRRTFSILLAMEV